MEIRTGLEVDQKYWLNSMENTEVSDIPVKCRKKMNDNFLKKEKKNTKKQNQNNNKPTQKNPKLK